MAFYLLERDRDGGQAAEPGAGRGAANGRPLQALPHAHRERAVRDLRIAPQRDAAQLCVVESPADVVAIEQSGGFRGPLLRADGAPVAARRHRAGRTRPGRVRAAARRGRGARGDPRDQSDRGGRGDRALSRRARPAPRPQGVAHRARRAGRRRARIRRRRHAGACAGGAHQRHLASGERRVPAPLRAAPASRTGGAAGDSFRSGARRSAAVGDRGAHRAARLLQVAAIVESALAPARESRRTRAPRRARCCAGGAKSRTPGASIIADSAPAARRYQRAVVVVCRPSAVARQLGGLRRRLGS